MHFTRRVLWFGVAGIAGFAADACVMTLLARGGFDLRIARLLSFSGALVVTWLINRSLAFGDRAGEPTVTEFLRYAAASSIAALINLGLFMGLVSFTGFFAAWPILALALATGLSMTVNFASYLRIVFAGGDGSPVDR